MNYTKFAVGNEILAGLRQFWSKCLSGVVVERERERVVQYLVDFRTSPCPKVGAGKAFAITFIFKT